MKALVPKITQQNSMLMMKETKREIPKNTDHIRSIEDIVEQTCQKYSLND